MNDTAEIPFPPTHDSDETEEIEDTEEETDSEEVDESEDDEEEVAPKPKAKKSAKPEKSKAKAKGRPAKAKKSKETFTLTLAQSSIEIPDTPGGTDPLRIEMAEKACKEGWQNCTTLAPILRCSAITARHYLYQAAKQTGAQGLYKLTGKRGVPSLHVSISTKGKKK